MARPGNALGYSADGEEAKGGGVEGAAPRLLNLRHDLTPIKYVGMVVTEVGPIPPTAVPALLREYRRELGAAPASGF